MGSGRLEQVLSDEFGLSALDIEEALQRQVVFGGALDTNFLEAELIDEQRLTQALALACGLPGVGKAEIDTISPQIPALLPLVFAETYHLAPYKLVGNQLTVLVSKTVDEALFARLGTRLQVELSAVVTSEVRLHYAMYLLYGTALQPRFRALIEKLDGTLPRPMQQVKNPAPDENTTQNDRLLSWGISGAHIAPPRQVRTQNGPSVNLRSLVTQIEQADDRDVVVDVLLQAALAFFDYASFFLVHNDAVQGWRSTSPEQTQRVARISLPVSLPSVFQTVYATQAHYLGPLPSNSVNNGFLAGIGRDNPRTSFLAPVRVGGKLAAILYADNGPRGVAHKRVTALLLLTQRAGLTLEEIIRRRKAALAASTQSGGAPGPQEKTKPPPLPSSIPRVEFAQTASARALPGNEVVFRAPPPKAVAPGLPETAASPSHVAPVMEPQAELEAPDDTLETAFDDSAEAARAAFERGILEHAVELDVDDLEEEQDDTDDDAYVAFADVEDEDSLGDWEDVLLDTALAKKEASEAPLVVHPRGAPTIGWDDVLAEMGNTELLHAPEPLQTVQVAGASMNEHELLLEGLEASDSAILGSTIERLLQLGHTLDDELRNRFPGANAFNPFESPDPLPAFSKCSGILALLEARGADAAHIVMPHLESPDALKRYYAVYYLYAVFYPAACDALARRLYDSQPHVRAIAVEALRRYVAEPSYKRIVQGLREQLKVPVIETQIATIMLLGQLREPSAVPSLIPLVASSQSQLAGVASSALAVICCQAFGYNLPSWQQWWHDHYKRPRVVWLLEGLSHPHEMLRQIADSELQQLCGLNVGFDPTGSEAIRARGVEAWYDAIGSLRQRRANRAS